MINRPPGSSLSPGQQVDYRFVDVTWWSVMPHGQDWTPPATPAQPVQEIRFRQVQGRTSNQTTNVVEYLYASVGAEHLRRGTNTNSTVREWVRQEVGRSNDDAGHIIGKNQGGLGTQLWNIFPQNLNFNRGVFADVEAMIHGAVSAGNVRIWFHFIYGDAAAPGRPTQFWYYILFPNGQTMMNDLSNP